MIICIENSEVYIKKLQDLDAKIALNDRDISFALKEITFIRDDLKGFGEEGNHMYNGTEGTDFDALLSLKNIDYGTFHMYPEAWGILPEYVENWGAQYIKDHIFCFNHWCDVRFCCSDYSCDLWKNS